MESTTAYRSEQLLRIDGQQEPAIVWTVEHVVPDRYHVYQAAWEGDPGASGEVDDEWLMAGSDHFMKIGGWIRADQTSRMNEQFLVQKYIELLDRPDLRDLGVWLLAGRNYLRLECPSLPSSSARLLEVPEESGRTEMWIDLSTDALARGDQIWSQRSEEGGTELCRVEVFFDLGGTVSIQPPERVWAE